jgi:hypothetical protein
VPTPARKPAPTRLPDGAQVGPGLSTTPVLQLRKDVARYRTERNRLRDELAALRAELKAGRMPDRNLVQHHGTLGAHGPEGDTLYASVPMELARGGQLSIVARSVALYVWSQNEKWQQSAAAIADALGMDRKTVAPAWPSYKTVAGLSERSTTTPVRLGQRGNVGTCR